MTRLICCLDGTWNNDKGDVPLTNVAKLHQNILPQDEAGNQQVSHYITGIASGENIHARFLQGAIGLEVDDRIKEAYAKLAADYEPGDELFLFGFSRGAFEARCLAAFILLFGLAKKDAEFSIDQAWDLYCKHPDWRDAAQMQSLHAASHSPVKIKCIGVWDTVGNLGNPFSSKGFLGQHFDFLETGLHPSIEVGLHALSIDEKRGPFSPSLWTMPSDATLPENQHVEQVWFPGVHADIGGGYEETELSDIALMWMIERATAKTGIAFDLDALAKSTKPNPRGVQHESATGAIFKWSGRLPHIRLINQNKNGVPLPRRWLTHSWRTSKVSNDRVVVNESVHESAMSRYGQTVYEVKDGEYSEVLYQPHTLMNVIKADPDASPSETSGNAGADSIANNKTHHGARYR